MSLKGTNNTPIIPPRDRIIISYAIEDLKNGKKNAKKRLYKYVKKGMIQAKTYTALVEQFEKEKENRKREIYLFGYPIKDYLPLLFFFSIIAAISIILYAIENPNFWVYGSTIYLLIAFFMYHYSNVDDKQHKDYEISELKQEIRNLESNRKSDKHIIELLEKELEKTQGNSNL